MLLDENSIVRSLQQAKSEIGLDSVRY